MNVNVQKHKSSIPEECVWNARLKDAPYAKKPTLISASNAKTFCLPLLLMANVFALEVKNFLMKMDSALSVRSLDAYAARMEVKSVRSVIQPLWLKMGNVCVLLDKIIVDQESARIVRLDAISARRTNALSASIGMGPT